MRSDERRTRTGVRRLMNAAPGEDAPAGVDAAEETVFLPDCDPGDWKRIVDHCDRRRFLAGEEIVREGEVDRALLIVTEGVLEVVVGPAGKERPLDVIEAPSIVGEMSFFDDAPRSATLRARTDGEFLRFSLAAFEVLAAETPALARAILLEAGRILALRLRWANALNVEQPS